MKAEERRSGIILSAAMLITALFPGYVVWRFWFANDGRHLMAAAVGSVIFAAMGLLCLVASVGIFLAVTEDEKGAK